MRHSSPRWPRLALPLGVGGRVTTGYARTLDSNGRHLPSPPSRSIRAGIWRCATPRAPRQLPSLTPPDREIQTPEANSRVDKTWGQGQEERFTSRAEAGMGTAARLLRRSLLHKNDREQRKHPFIESIGPI